MSDMLPISDEALDAFKEAHDDIVGETVRRSMLIREHVAHHEDQASRLIASGLNFTVNMLEAAMISGRIELLEDQMKWAMERLPHDGVLPEHIAKRLELMADVIKEKLDPGHSSQIAPYLEWMISSALK